MAVLLLDSTHLVVGDGQAGSVASLLFEGHRSEAPIPCSVEIATVKGDATHLLIARCQILAIALGFNYGERSALLRLGGIKVAAFLGDEA
jgi:hypothetical protein